MTAKEMIHALCDSPMDSQIYIQLANGKRVRLEGIDCDALRQPPQPVYLVAARPLALATATAARDDDGPSCYCKGGAFAAEFGEETARLIREAVSA